MKEDNLDLGSVKIHKRAISEIIALAISETRGVSLIKPNLFCKILEYFPNDGLYGVEVHVEDNSSIALKLNLIVQYGVNILDLVREIQDVVKIAVRKSLNIEVTSINIYIRGIEGGKNEIIH